MPYEVHAKVNVSAFSVMVETANDALAKLAELTDLGHAEVVVRDLLGTVIDPSILETEADAMNASWPPPAALAAPSTTDRGGPARAPRQVRAGPASQSAGASV